MKNKKLDFIKINPAGNMTILIENYDITSKNLMEISENLMKETNIYAEQVGFIKDNHLQMMGGEFCGNASRAFASFLTFRDKEFKEQKFYTITCSGANENLKVDVRRSIKNNEFLAKIKMPQYLSMEDIKIQNKEKEYKFILVEFEGIHHFIYELNQDENINKMEIINLIKSYLEKEEYSAFGVMFYREKINEMAPYVYVKGFSEGVWENSCASGTTALGFYLNKYKNIEKAKIIEPNGWLEYSFENGEIYIDGPVEIVAEGKVYI